MGIISNRRRVYGGKKGLLPSGYVQLEYIENTSSAYIDTGLIVGDYPLLVNAKHSYSSGESIMGFGKSLQGGGDGIALLVYNNKFSNIIPGVSYNTFMDVTHDVIEFNWALGNGTSIFTGDLQHTTTNKCFNYGILARTYTFKLFRSADKYAPLSRGKSFYLRLCQDGILVRDYIPCKNPNNVVGMYDTVNGVFYSSPNGTAFIAGPDV